MTKHPAVSLDVRRMGWEGSKSSNYVSDRSRGLTLELIREGVVLGFDGADHVNHQQVKINVVKYAN